MSLPGMVQVLRQQLELLSKYSVDSDTSIDNLILLTDLGWEYARALEALRTKRMNHLQELCNPIIEKALDAPNILSQGKALRRARKSFNSIYIDPEARASDDVRQQVQREKHQNRALKIRKLGCDRALILAATLSFSDWALRLSEPKLDYVLKVFPEQHQVQEEDMSNVMEKLQTWSSEKPLADCENFQASFTALKTQKPSPVVDPQRNYHYVWSDIPFDKIPIVFSAIPEELWRSALVKEEQRRGVKRSQCVTAMLTSNEKEDCMITLRVSRTFGWVLVENLDLIRLIPRPDSINP